MKTRAARSKRGIIAIAIAVLACAPGFAAEPIRGGRVGWARLITPSSQWDIHTDQDPKLARFIRSQTSLNIDPTWYTADPADLEELCAYPFVYAKDLTLNARPKVQDNLKEYLRRGGFILIDPCIARFPERSVAQFVKNNAELFARLSPGSEVRLLPADHELFHCYFHITVADLYTPDMARRGASPPPYLEIHGVFQGDRLIALISLVGLECGWPQTPERMPGCMKMIVNTYVYAMTR